MQTQWLYHLTAAGIRGLSLVAKFLLMLGLVHYFQPDDLGLYGIISALVAFSLFFLGLEFYNYTSRTLIGASKRDQVLIMRDQFVLYGLFFLMMSPIFYGLFYFHVLPSSLYWLFLAVVLTEHTSNELMRILVVLSRPFLANIIYFIRQGLWALILLPIFYCIPQSHQMSYVLLAWVLGALVSIFVSLPGLAHLPWSSVWHNPVNWSMIRQGLMIARPFLVTAFCALSMLYIERFFVTYYCGLSDAGIYTFYASLSLTLHNLVNAGVSKMRLSHLLSAYQQNNRQKF